jgi:hypothetical protein
MFMIFPQALYAFLFSIFGSAFPYQELYQPPSYSVNMHEVRIDRNIVVAQPMELIDGSYTAKK